MTTRKDVERDVIAACRPYIDERHLHVGVTGEDHAFTLEPCPRCELLKRIDTVLAAPADRGAEQIADSGAPVIDFGGQPTGLRVPRQPAGAQAGQTATLTEAESLVISNLLQLASAVEHGMDDSEERNDGTNLEQEHANLICVGLACLDDLPDDMPGYTMCGPTKARWALRRIMPMDWPPLSPPDSPRGGKA